MRIRTLDDFAIQLKNEPKYPVRRRVLRAEVHRVIAYLSHYSTSP
jgi:hypothetical protein